MEENDSEATISDGEGVIISSELDESDSELVVEDWSNRTRTQKTLALTDFERDFVHMHLAGKFSEAQGDMIIELVRKYNSSIKSRKPKALVNHLVNVSVDHYHYVECDCGSILKKVSNKFFCLKCQKHPNVNALANYVAMNVEEQLKMVSKQFPQLFENNSSNELTLQLIIACDEIPISKSSNLELLPVLLYIENIRNLNLRNKCYMVAAIALLNKKEKEVKYNTNLLLQTFHKEFHQINTNGIETHWSKCTKLEVSAFIGDNPCRSKFLNIQQHNGRYPCHRCYIMKPVKENLPVYRYDELRLKSHELANRHVSSIEHLRRTTTSGKRIEHEMGFKGKTLLSEFNNFDYINGSVVEIMHCLFLGVVKNSLKVFVKDGMQEVKKLQIDKRISMLKPPSNSKRSIRPLTEFAHYKSAEFEMIFFYYGYFMFKDIMTNDQFNLFMFLSSATFKLWSRKSTLNDIENSKVELDHFMSIFKRKISQAVIPFDLQTYNLHALLHLHEDRLKYGPLCNINAYGY